jgi:hypothetical protein
VFAFLVFPGIFSVREAKATCAAGTYCYRMPITVNSGQVSGSPTALTDFPFLFNTTNANLANPATGHVTSANGYDIIFRALDDATCGTGLSPCTLNHEIEKYNASTGKFIAWVKVPYIKDTTVIYIYYGNSSVTTSQEHKTTVWDSNYAGVWHNKETLTGSGQAVGDSAANANNGSSQGSWASGQQTAGQIAGSLNFDGATDYLNVADAASLNPTSVTLSSWVKTSTSGKYIIAKDPACSFGSSIAGGKCQGFITSGTSWAGASTDGSNITVECIGGGASVGNGGGGGGGEYRKGSFAYTPKSSVPVAIGAGGRGGIYNGESYGLNGGDTN